MQEAAGGYRLKTSDMAEFSRIVDSFRAEALKKLASGYASMVAEETLRAAARRPVRNRQEARDAVAGACATLRASLKGRGRVAYPGLNCVLDFHPVRDAVLACLVHGSDDVRAMWEATPGVIRWGWVPDRQEGVSARQWEMRRKYWHAALSRRGFACPLRFTLIMDGLPEMGLESVRRFVPDFERKLAETRPPAKRRQPAVPAPAAKPAPPRPPAVSSAAVPQGGAAKPAVPSGAGRMRAAAEKARIERAAAAAVKRPVAASVVDHADVVVSSDRRTFVAVPWVGFDPQARIFVQVGDSHVAFVQNGMQFGLVTDVRKSAVDVLRACRTVVLVETESRDGRRLLRAKHVAIVSDIGLSENLVSASTGGFRTAGNRGTGEWE